MIHDALFWSKENERIRCRLCPHNCLIAEGKAGLCSVRVNKNGTLKTENYGMITAMAVDPIEKKPLYHFKPGTRILSVGSFGCNFFCGYCQNYHISRFHSKSEFLPPEQLAASSSAPSNNIGIAFTYNEPSIWYEYVYDTSVKLKEMYPRMKIVLVTNGYIELEALEKLLPYVDAMNIDLKSMKKDFYHKVCGGQLQNVLNTIEASFGRCHVEVTTLLVSGLNDSEAEAEKIALYLSSLDRNIPLHFSRYYPAYKMSLPATDIEVMIRAKEAAKKHLNYVYLGNIPNADCSSYCHQCGKLLVQRMGFSAKSFIEEPVCPQCNSKIPFIL
ncbi:MAG TPA: AmmeMemoRadiSam system radical SAM enzyme [Clostridiales bacterium]|nr:AmmeMemoRadiSam system radical SAM enzyme [Clostridiales bacterium]